MDYYLKSKKSTWEKLNGAIRNRGELLTCFEDFKTCTSRVKLKCNCGFIWEPVANSIYRPGSNRWCPKCAGRSATVEFGNALERLINKINGRGVVLEHPEKVTTKSIVKIQCNCGHIWVCNASRIIHDNHWCGKCNTGGRKKKQ